MASQGFNVTKRLVIGNYLGRQQSFIQKSGGDASLSDVQANINDFVFHSDFKQLVELGETVHTFNLPAIASIKESNPNSGGKNPQPILVTVKKYVSHYLLGGISIDAGVHCISQDVATGASLMGGFPLQFTNDSFQFVSIEYIGNEAYLRVDSDVGEESLLSQSITVKTQMFRVDSSIDRNSGIIAKIEPERVQFAQGAFDSDRKYLYETSESGVGVFKIPLEKILKLDFTMAPNAPGYTYHFLGLSYSFNNIMAAVILDTYVPNQIPIKLKVL